MSRRKVALVSLAMLVVAVSAVAALFVLVGPERLRVLKEVSRADVLRCEAIRARARDVVDGTSQADFLAAIDEVLPLERIVAIDLKRFRPRGDGDVFVTFHRGAFQGDDPLGLLPWDEESEIGAGQVVGLDAKAKATFHVERRELARVSVGPLARLLLPGAKQPSLDDPLTDPFVLTHAKGGTRAVCYRWVSRGAKGRLELELIFTMTGS